MKHAAPVALDLDERVGRVVDDRAGPGLVFVLLPRVQRREAEQLVRGELRGPRRPCVARSRARRRRDVRPGPRRRSVSTGNRPGNPYRHPSTRATRRRCDRGSARRRCCGSPGALLTRHASAIRRNGTLGAGFVRESRRHRKHEPSPDLARVDIGKRRPRCVGVSSCDPVCAFNVFHRLADRLLPVRWWRFVEGQGCHSTPTVVTCPLRTRSPAEACPSTGLRRDWRGEPEGLSDELSGSPSPDLRRSSCRRARRTPCLRLAARRYGSSSTSRWHRGVGRWSCRTGAGRRTPSCRCVG